MRVLGGHNPARECLPIDPPENDLMQLREVPRGAKGYYQRRDG